MACAYADIFGRPGEGAHARRVGGLAGVDLALTAGLAFVVGRKRRLAGSQLLAILAVFIILIIVAIGVHEMFCVNTRLNAWIFRRPWP